MHENSPSNLFFASSMCELASAVVVRRFLGDQSARLVFDLSNSHEMRATRQTAESLAEKFDLRPILFLEPDFCPVRGDLSQSGVRRFFGELRRGWNVPDELREMFAGWIGSGPVVGSGIGLAVWFTYLHTYVLHSMGVFPDAKRIYYPHGLDQPRRHQLHELPFYFQPRGSVGSSVSWTAQRSHYRRSVKWVARMLKLGGRSQIPVPFDGVDAAVTLSPLELPVPHQRVPPEILRSAILDMANTIIPESSEEGPWADYVPAQWCVILLPVENGADSNPWLLPAIRLLIQKITSREPVRTFVIKPHPRTSWEKYVSFMKGVGPDIAGYNVQVWPRSALTILTEVACAKWEFRCVGSLASCAMAPWASFIPHYVSTSAARLLDQDTGSSSAFRYTSAAKMLDLEGIAIDLG